MRNSEWCLNHHPDKAEERRRRAAKGGKRGGRGKANGAEVTALKEEVRTLITHVREGGLDRNDAAVMIQGYRVLRDLIELERKVRTTEELSEELRELRERIALSNGTGQRRYSR